jgi:hypothetical protein
VRRSQIVYGIPEGFHISLSQSPSTRSAAPSPVLKDRGEKARLRVNPEQALAFRPGSRRVDCFKISEINPLIKATPAINKRMGRIF